MSLADRLRAEREEAVRAQARRVAAVANLLRPAWVGTSVHDLHERLQRGGTLARGTPLDVTRRALAVLEERGEAHRHETDSEVWYRGPAPRVPTPPQGSLVEPPGSGGGERTSSPTPGATAGPELSAGPSESTLRTPASGPAGVEEEPSEGVRPTSPPAPAAGDTPSPRGEQAQNRHRHPDPAPSDDPRLTAPDQDGPAEDGRNAGDRVEADGAVRGEVGATGPCLDSRSPSDAARASEARITAAAPAGETEGVCAPAVVVPSEPAPLPPESTMSLCDQAHAVVLRQPGIRLTFLALALGADLTTLGRELRADPRFEVRKAGEHRSAPVTVFAASPPPSPSSPPGERAPASGGDLPEDTTDREQWRRRAEALADRVVAVERERDEIREQWDGYRATVLALHEVVEPHGIGIVDAVRSWRAQNVESRRHNDVIAALLGAPKGDDAEVLRIASALQAYSQGEAGDDAAEVLRLAIVERDRALSELGAVYDALWPEHIPSLPGPPPGWVDAAVRRIREPLEAALGGGELVAGLTLVSLADEVERLVGGLRQHPVAYVAVDRGEQPHALLDELGARASASGLRVPRSGGHAALVAYLLGWLEAHGVITAPAPEAEVSRAG